MLGKLLTSPSGSKLACATAPCSGFHANTDTPVFLAVHASKRKRDDLRSSAASAGSAAAADHERAATARMVAMDFMFTERWECQKITKKKIILSRSPSWLSGPIDEISCMRGGSSSEIHSESGLLLRRFDFGMALY